MRDHRELRAFDLADELALAIYRATGKFPREELFGLTSQMRRCAVSIASNIVEGCGRRTEADYVRFLDTANASARELEYQLSLYVPPAEIEPLSQLAGETNKVLAALIRALRNSS